MCEPISISPTELFNRIGTGDQPLIVDVCIREDFADDPRHIPSSVMRAYGRAAAGDIPELRGRDVVVVCHKGLKLSEGVAAHLRHRGVRAINLEGGRVAWAVAGLPMVPADKVPKRDGAGATVWVTRTRPKIDRVACPWLIRRFVDPQAVILFVAPDQVPGVAERFGATPFDIEDVFWSHRGATCTFDTMVEEFGLSTPALDYLADIVRGADTARLDLAPEAAGLLAVSLGLSHRFHDDIEQVQQAFALYDALYLWCRDGRGETHNWPARTVRG